MLNVLLHSQIGLLSIITVLGAVVSVVFWLIYFMKHQNDKKD